jgi:hypothetical protein
MKTNRDDLRHLKKQMDLSLNSKYIYEHIGPKHRKDIFDLYNSMLDYLDGKEYKDEELAKETLKDWYNQYFKKQGGIKTKFLIKYTEDEKFKIKQNNYKNK